MSAALDLRPDHHRHAVSFIDWARRDFLAEILWRSLFATSINSDLDVLECFVPLSVGGASVILRTVIDSAPALAEVNLFNTVPSAMHKSLRAGALPPNVRMVHLAGEMLHRQLAQTFFSRSQVQHLRNVWAVVNHYLLSLDYSAAGGRLSRSCRPPALQHPDLHAGWGWSTLADWCGRRVFISVELARPLVLSIDQS